MFSLVMSLQSKHTNLTGVRPASCAGIPVGESRRSARPSNRKNFKQYTATIEDTVRAFPELW